MLIPHRANLPQSQVSQTTYVFLTHDLGLFILSGLLSAYKCFFLRFFIHTDSTDFTPLTPELSLQSLSSVHDVTPPLFWLETNWWLNALSTVWAQQLLLLPWPSVPPLGGLWPWSRVSLSPGMSHACIVYTLLFHQTIVPLNLSTHS